MEERKHSLWMGIGEKVISFVVGVVVAAFLLGGARQRVNTLGKEMDAWKIEWKEKDKHITAMDLEGSVATKNFVAQYNKEQAVQNTIIKELQSEVRHLETMDLRIKRLEEHDR